MRLDRSVFFVTSLGALAFTLAAGTASAQDVEPPAPPVAPSPGETGSLAGTANDMRYRDANADRVILGSTAETHPKGTFYVSDYEILLLQFGYAFTDQLQLQLTGTPPIVQNQPYWFEAGAKFNLYRGDAFRAAITGGLDVLTTGGSGSGGPYYGGRLGAIGQICFNADGTCRSSVSLNVGTIITSGASQVLPVYGSAGFIVNVSKIFSILAEPAMLGAVGTGATNVNAGAFFVLDYGVRLSGGNFGADLTFIKPVADTVGQFNDPFILGYPFVAFTYRTDGDSKPREPHATGGDIRLRGF
jgi:hypothetical protein